jgi:hypothetical protein
MVVNFKTRKFSRGARKLNPTFMLIIIKKYFKIGDFLESLDYLSIWKLI